MNSRIEELCKLPIAGEPITQQEILDCLLLTAALDREHVIQIKQAMEAMMICVPGLAFNCKKTLAELRSLPELRRENPALLIDHVSLEDRLPEMRAAWQTLRTLAAANPNQAAYLKTAADTLEDSWTPLNPDG